MAKSRSIGGIYAYLTLKDGGFRKGLAAARKELIALGGKAMTGLAAGTAATGIALTYATKKTLEMAGALDDASVNTGIAISDMMKLRKEWELGGLAADGVGKDVGRMQKTIAAAASGGKDPFASMGLSAQKLMEIDPAQQFRTIGASILRIQNPTERAAKAMEIFGKSGTGLINVFGQAEDASKFLGKMPEVMQQYAGAMARADDLINELPGKGQQFVTGFTAGIIGELVPALEKTAEFDFTTLGENLGKALAIGTQALTDGSVWDLFVLHAEKALLSLSATGQGGGGGGLFDQVVNGWAASVNAFFTSHAPGGGGWETFGENFDKYAAAGTEGAADAMQERIDKLAALQERIDAIQNRTLAKFDFKRAEAAKANGREKEDPPDEDPLMRPTFADPMAFTNAYAQRGLSLSAGGGISGEEKNQTKLLGEVRDLLERIANSRGQLVWGKS